MNSKKIIKSLFFIIVISSVISGWNSYYIKKIFFHSSGGFLDFLYINVLYPAEYILNFAVISFLTAGFLDSRIKFLKDQNGSHVLIGAVSSILLCFVSLGGINPLLWGVKVSVCIVIAFITVSVAYLISKEKHNMERREL